jgi:hypothetical protein
LRLSTRTSASASSSRSATSDVPVADGEVELVTEAVASPVAGVSNPPPEEEEGEAERGGPEAAGLAQATRRKADSSDGANVVTVAGWMPPRVVIGY